MTDISIRIHATVSSAIRSAMSSLHRQEGQDLIEYALLGGLIAAAIVAVGIIFNGALVTMSSNIGDCLDFDGVTDCTFV